MITCVVGVAVMSVYFISYLIQFLEGVSESLFDSDYCRQNHLTSGVLLVRHGVVSCMVVVVLDLLLH